MAIVLLTNAVSTLAAGPAELDFSAWQRMPVFDNGRMMPINTFARAIAEEVTGRASLRLSLEGAAGPDGADPPGLEASRKLFAGAKERQFSAAELLFSWLVEPKRWECVPFLAASHEALRQEILGLPIVGRDGKRLKYVSPWQVEHSAKLNAYWMALARKDREAEQNGQKPELTALDRKVRELYEAYTRYRRVTFDPAAPAAGRGRFLHWLSSAIESWRRLEPELKRLAPLDPNETEGLLEATAKAAEKLLACAEADPQPLADLERHVVAFCEATAALAREYAALKNKVFRTGRSGADTAELKRLRALVHAASAGTAELARAAREAHLALYDNGHALRLVPALNPGALEKNRDPDDDSPPWLSFQTLICGSEAVLRGYPRDLVLRVREDYDRVARAYTVREAPDRPGRFAAAMSDFAASVRQLGEQIEPLRQQLPIRQRDQELIAATAYPPPDYTWAEVHYYRLDPFFWSWVVSLIAVSCFALSFGVIRKPMFALGIAVMLAAQLMTIYGLGLRVYITGWAPVTNMFETVIFVALVVGLLGLWFTVVPLAWPGLSVAWRMTAVPGTPEAGALGRPQPGSVTPDRWNSAGWLLLPFRLAVALAIFWFLAIVPYGGQTGFTIVRLRPRIDVGASLPTIGNLVVWLVGLAMLALAMWLVPRAIIASALSTVTVPYAWARHGLRKPLAQVLARKPFALVGASVGLLAALVAYYAPVFDKNINPLMPVLRDNFWLTMHVLTITASYGAGALAWGLGNIALGYYLLGRYRDPLVPLAETSPANLAPSPGASLWQSGDGSGRDTGAERSPSPGAAALGHEEHRPAGDYHPPPESRTRRPPEVCNSLGSFTYKSMQVAVLLLAAGTILGGLWADVSWGRFWGWDSKEVWALVSLLVYLAILHGRYAGVFGNFGLAIGSIFGATAILMAWYGVNYWLGSGLHAYAEGTGGLTWVMAILGANWAFAAAAAVRYLVETRLPVATPSNPRTPSPAGQV